MANDVFDKDGLLYTKHINLKKGMLFLQNKQIFVTPEANNVLVYLMKFPVIWEQARICVRDSKSILGRAPIFGVPFNRGLREALQSNKSHKKILYQRNDWKVMKGHAVVGSLLAHISSTATHVQLEAWQLMDITSETFYVHAIIDKEKTELIHLDGATMHHSDEEKHLILRRGNKIKGNHYTKHFRIDGHLPIAGNRGTGLTSVTR